MTLPSSLRAALLVASATPVLAVGGSPLEAQSPESIWAEVELAPGILGFVTVEGVNPSSYANTIVVSGTTATLVVDTQDRPLAATRIARAIEARGLPPVRWVLNTHWHSDHTIGTEAILEAWPQATVTAHPATADSLREGGRRAIAESQARLQGTIDRIEEALENGDVPEADVPRYVQAMTDRRDRIDELDGVRVVVPRPMADDRVELDLGGRTVVLIHPGPAHTRGDVVAWVPDARFLAAGDLLEEAPLWLDGADVAGWAAALDALTGLDPAVVLPSHGRARGDAELLAAHTDILARAVRVAASGTESEAGIQAEFTDLEPRLHPYGVTGEDFRAYVVEAVRRLREAR